MVPKMVPKKVPRVRGKTKPCANMQRARTAKMPPLNRD